MTKTVMDVLNAMDDMVNELIDECDGVSPEALGLDRRSAYRLWVSDEGIFVRAGSDDRTLQYYGGFEYVDKDYRKELGQYVFYSIEDDRVYEHIERMNYDADNKETI